MALFEGNCIGKVTNVDLGADTSGQLRVRWDIQVTEGPNRGKIAKYSGKFDGDNAKFTKRDMKAVGWKGADVLTFVKDAEAAACVISFVAEVASVKRPNGKIAQWTSARAIGVVLTPLAKLTADAAEKLNQQLTNAGEIGPQSGNAAPVADDEIPF